MFRVRDTLGVESELLENKKKHYFEGGFQASSSDWQ